MKPKRQPTELQRLRRKVATLKQVAARHVSRASALSRDLYELEAAHQVTQNAEAQSYKAHSQTVSMVLTLQALVRALLRSGSHSKDLKEMARASLKLAPGKPDINLL